MDHRLVASHVAHMGHIHELLIVILNHLYIIQVCKLWMLRREAVELILVVDQLVFGFFLPQRVQP